MREVPMDGMLPLDEETDVSRYCPASAAARKKIEFLPVAHTERSFLMKRKFDTKMMVTAGLLIALQIILSRFLSINAWNLKIGFAFTAVFVAAYLYGPLFAAVVAAIADVVGAALFPSGAFFPGFTVTAILSGLLFGLLLYKKQTPGRIAITVAIDQLVLGLLLNSYWLSILYGSPYVPLLATRAVQCLIMMPVMYFTMAALSKLLARSKKQIV